jgi:K+-transporting ATPase A subunit
VNTTVDK